jgi:hypothetical protein
MSSSSDAGESQGKMAAEFLPWSISFIHIGFFTMP